MSGCHWSGWVARPLNLVWRGECGRRRRSERSDGGSLRALIAHGGIGVILPSRSGSSHGRTERQVLLSHTIRVYRPETTHTSRREARVRGD